MHQAGLDRPAIALQGSQKPRDDANLGEIVDVFKLGPGLILLAVKIEKVAQEVTKDLFPRVTLPVVVLLDRAGHRLEVEAKLAGRRDGFLMELGQACREPHRLWGCCPTSRNSASMKWHVGSDLYGPHVKTFGAKVGITWRAFWGSKSASIICKLISCLMD